jgi:hypothetical protein
MTGGGGAPACGERNGRAGELQWKARKLIGRSVWGGRERRGELHEGPKLTAAQWWGGGALARARRPGRPFYRQ